MLEYLFFIARFFPAPQPHSKYVQSILYTTKYYLTANTETIDFGKQNYLLAKKNLPECL